MRAGVGCGFVVVGVALLRCSSSPAPTPIEPSSGLQPGEICDPTNSATLDFVFDPPNVVVAPGQSRPVRVIADPDICSATTATMAIADQSLASAPTSATFDLRHATFDFDVTGVAGAATGATSLSITMAYPVGSAPTTVTLPIVVQPATVQTCTASTGDTAAGGFNAQTTSLSGAGDLALAQMSVPPGAFTIQDELAFPPFNGQIACGGDLSQDAPGAPIALGPAVTFSAGNGLVNNQALRREVSFAIPVNPAAMPPGARMRHVQMLFKSPMAVAPRYVTITNPQFSQPAGQSSWVMTFQSPWIGTYQAVVAPTAGTVQFTRHLTHRAVIGISMGGGGAATFGVRHHDQFDVIGPLGGPSDWTWLLWYIQQFHIGGFCPANNPNCTIPAPNLYPIDGPFVHTQDFNHWFYQPGGGNGGTFNRHEYAQLFWDLSAMQGNPNGTNVDPTLVYFPPGPKATDPWVVGNLAGLPSGADCAVPVDPVDGDPQNALEQQIQSQCYSSRCDPQHVWTAPTGYYDATYNPDGSKPVISFCDGANDPNAVSPYVNTWAQPTSSQAIPMNPAFAVDLNGNGLRDMNEPVIRQGQEPWDDTGTDGLFDEAEPGYDVISNPDPNQDDYDYVINPNGTEKNHHYESGEPYQDVGLDGVPGTPQQSAGGYDLGEGDGKFTTSAGLANFYAQDPHQIVHGWQTDVPGGPFDDAALQRLDVWTDGGVRDLFNFGVVANHFIGAIAGRATPNGTPLKPTVFYDNFENLPGGSGNINTYQPEDVLWNDVTGAAMVRYGTVDATPAMITQGDGQHVGTATQILFRLETSFYYVASKWPDVDRTRTNESDQNPETTTTNVLGTACEIAGTCTTNFTGPVTQRTGPIVISLPPGYALEDNRLRNLRYPVMYVLHGYGQTPSDLEAVAVLFNNRVNSGLTSYARRLAKFIIVYVDGRCRIGQKTDPNNVIGEPECVEGTFYMNSVRPKYGAEIDSWFDEVIDYVDQNYRTAPPSDVQVTE
jgi:hypothetical protein